MEKLKRTVASGNTPPKLEFFGAVHSGGGVSLSDRDFSASLVKSKGKERISMVFRNDTANEISKNGRVEFAIDGTRLYFRESQGRGYKVSVKTNEKNAYIQSAHPAIVEFFKQHGNVDKDIKADNDRRAYYIETSTEWI